jgi:hypothetical protein
VHYSGEIHKILTIHEQMALVRLFDRQERKGRKGKERNTYIMHTETVDPDLVERNIHF